MSSNITATGDCRGCGVHVQPQSKDDDWDYCECDSYQYKIFDGNPNTCWALLLYIDVLLERSSENVIEIVQDILGDINKRETEHGRTAIGKKFFAQITGPGGKLFVELFEDQR